MGGEGEMPLARHEARLTYDDFLRFPDDGLRHELIDGEHVVTPSPNTRHQRLVGRLHAAFVLYLREHPEAGEAFVAPLDVVLGFHDVVEPDLLLVMADQQGILTDQHVRGAPAIVVEVLSPGTRARDEGAKLRLFARTGVREYWLVDPDASEVTVYRRGEEGAFARAAALAASRHDRLTTPRLPGFAVGVAELMG